MPKPYHTPKSERDEAVAELTEQEETHELPWFEEVEESTGHTDRYCTESNCPGEHAPGFLHLCSEEAVTKKDSSS